MLYTMEYQSAMRKKEICHLWKHGVPWGHYAQWSESEKKKPAWYHLYVESEKSKPIETVKVWLAGGEGNGEILVKMYRLLDVS